MKLRVCRTVTSTINLETVKGEKRKSQISLVIMYTNNFVQATLNYKPVFINEELYKFISGLTQCQQNLHETFMQMPVNGRSFQQWTNQIITGPLQFGCNWKITPQ